MQTATIAFSINRVHEVAPWSRSTTYKLVREGRLRARKLGSSTFVLRADLDEFISTLPEAVAVAESDSKEGRKP